jgi:hypothetical protein
MGMFPQIEGSVMFVQIVNNAIVPDTLTNRLPLAARRLDNGDWVLGLRDADSVKQQSTGWYEVVETNSPVVTETQRAESTIELVNNVPTRVWTIRAETAEETTNRIRVENKSILQDVEAALNFIQANEAYLTWYNSGSIQTIINGTGNLTSAQLSEAIRRLAPQVERLTRGVNRLTRLLSEELQDSIQSS